MKKSIYGLEENHAAALSCLFTFFGGLFFLVLEKENRFVRFHAMQSTLFGLAMLVLRFVLGLFTNILLIGILAGIANWLVGVVWFAVAAYTAYMAFKGHEFKLPVIGDIAYAQVNK